MDVINKVLTKKETNNDDIYTFIKNSVNSTELKHQIK